MGGCVLLYVRVYVRVLPGVQAGRSWWYELPYKENKFASAPKMDNSADPGASIMSLMKNLYEEVRRANRSGEDASSSSGRHNSQTRPLCTCSTCVCMGEGAACVYIRLSDRDWTQPSKVFSRSSEEDPAETGVGRSVHTRQTGQTCWYEGLSCSAADVSWVSVRGFVLCLSRL